VSQYPSPYTPPPYVGGMNYSGGGGDPRGPFRRAGVLLIVLGALGLLAGLCITASLAMVPFDQVIAQSGMPPEAFNGYTPQALKMVALIGFGLIALAGLVFLLLGVFVFRASRGAALGAAVITGLALGLGALWMLSAFVAAATQRIPQMALAICVFSIPMLLLILTMLFLVQALRAGNVRQMTQQQYLAQMWQMHQQASQNPPGYGYGYGQGGYGYAPPQGAPPPGAAAPPPSPAPEPPSVRHPPLPPDAGSAQGDDRSNP
jgi:hypothetical protein